MAVGIIAEYNPFHKGHLYQIQEVRKQFPEDPIIVVMSGDFVQRGGPALLSKWDRSAMALACGVDLIFELPLLYATQSAEIFAKGGISLLKSTGIVDHLVFGSESDDIDELVSTAIVLSEEKPRFQATLKKYLKQGQSFPKARSLAMEEFDMTLPKGSNDILGVEYIKQIIVQEANIAPHAIKRQGSSYHSLSTNEEFASASAIRQLMYSHRTHWHANPPLDQLHRHMPADTVKIMLQSPLSFDEDYFSLIRYFILRNFSDLPEIFDVKEGLEGLIYRSSLHATDLSHLLGAIKSKRYSMTRIRRILFNILLRIEKEAMREVLDTNDPPYLRILGFNERGRQCLNHIKKQSPAPLVNKPANFKPKNHFQQTLLSHQITAHNIYHMIRTPDTVLDSDYTHSPIYTTISLKKDNHL